MIAVSPVASRRDLQDFLRFPRLLYRGLPGYVAPLDMEREQTLSPEKAPFFQSNEAAFYLAHHDGKIVGRISAQILSDAPAQWPLKTGLFGCLDAVDDPRVIGKLLDAVGRWLDARGMNRMRGPFNLSSNGETGLQISGQSHMPMVMTPWHPPYLARHVETHGLQPVKDVVSYSLDLARLGPSDLKHHRSLMIRTAGDLKVRGLDLRHLLHDIQIITTVYNDAWSANWGFTPISDAEARALAASLKPIIQEDMAVIVERNGNPIAVALWIPNIQEMVADMDGRLLPFNWIKFLWRARRRAYSSCRVILLGVAQSERGNPSNLGLPAMMISELVRRSINHNIRQVELGWILEDNMGLRRTIERIGGTISTTHRIYEVGLPTYSRDELAANAIIQRIGHTDRTQIAQTADKFVAGL